MGCPIIGCSTWAKSEDWGEYSQGRVQRNQQMRPEAEDESPWQGIEVGCSMGWLESC